MSYYTLPVVHPGDKLAVVLPLKTKIKDWLWDSNVQANRNLHGKIGHHKDYGGHAVEAVRRFQRAHKLTADGIVGPSTWLKLGYKEHNLIEFPGYTRRGIPWQPGVVLLDGNWINVRVGRKLMNLRVGDKWDGVLTSGWRPNWYQKILWLAAVKKYGSEAAASKWVARPGTSNHRFRDARGACDITRADQVLRARVGFYQPMSWEDWHLQLRDAYTITNATGVRGFTGEEYEWEPLPEEIETAEHEVQEILYLMGKAA